MYTKNLSPALCYFLDTPAEAVIIDQLTNILSKHHLNQQAKQQNWNFYYDLYQAVNNAFPTNKPAVIYQLVLTRLLLHQPLDFSLPAIEETIKQIKKEMT